MKMDVSLSRPIAAGMFSMLSAPLLALLLAACNQAADSGPVFESAEYIILEEDAEARLNIAPCYVHSEDERVAEARLDDGKIVITSKGTGYTAVLAGDAAGLSNSARIEVAVDASGAITPAIHPFTGEKVRAVVKDPVRVGGTVDTPIDEACIRLMMDNSDFTGVEVGADVSGWITNLPQGLSAKITYVQDGEHPHEVDLTLSGVPRSVLSAPLEVVIPAENSAQGWAVYVESREDACFAITGR
jgi:hypothetical protein